MFDKFLRPETAAERRIYGTPSHATLKYVINGGS